MKTEEDPETAAVFLEVTTADISHLKVVQVRAKERTAALVAL